MDTLRQLWTHLKHGALERARYLRSALQPSLGEQAMLAALDHGVKKGLSVAAERQIEALVGTVAIEPHSIVTVMSSPQADAHMVQQLGVGLASWLRSKGHDTVEVVSVPEGSSIKGLPAKALRAYGWMRAVKGGKK